jgi:hypothetical protein
MIMQARLETDLVGNIDDLCALAILLDWPVSK